MPAKRHVRLFRIGRTQMIRVPRGFELLGYEAIILIHRDGNRLVIEPLKCPSLLAFLAACKPPDIDFPAIDNLPPLDDVSYLPLAAEGHAPSSTQCSKNP